VSVDEEYTPSGFTRKDYQRLAKMNRAIQLRDPEAAIFGLTSYLRIAQYRDKRIQRQMRYGMPMAFTVLTCPFEDVPLHIGSEFPPKNVLAQWRLELGR
jgi:hypothetical protein